MGASHQSETREYGELRPPYVAVRDGVVIGLGKAATAMVNEANTSRVSVIY